MLEALKNIVAEIVAEDPVQCAIIGLLLAYILGLVTAIVLLMPRYGRHL